MFNNNNSIDCDKEDNIYWITRLLFYKHNKNKIKQKKIKSKNLKDIIFNTLKFLYFNKKVEIIHEIVS